MTVTVSSKRLSTIIERESKTRLRDALFAVVVAIVAVVAVSTVSTASHVASSAYVAQR
jgi:hypothetical protein